MRFTRGTVGLIALAAVVSACGAYMKQDFVARANAICASTVRETRQIAPPTFTNEGAQRLTALAAYVAAVLPLVQAESTQLTGLRRPGGTAAERAALSRYLAAFAGVVGDYRSLAAAAKASDADGVARAEAQLNANPATALAAAYGLRSCGVPGATSAQ